MWKFVTRGIRETLERRANCRTNVYSQPSQDNNSKKSEVKKSLTCNHKLVAPCVSSYTSGFCGSARNEGTKDKQYQHGWNTKHCWTEAVGWSSILALGWVVCQSMCLRRRFVDKEQKECQKAKTLQLPQTRISYLFNQILNLQPTHFLPVTSCVGSSAKNLTHGGIETEWKAERAFGPVTVEEALKEATDEFLNTHNHVMGEYELHYGIKALDEKRFKDAMKHFLAGAKLSSPGSMFNLGLCYELGIGTSADQAKAAKYYNDAAKYDHADAMYNLGVFHAQGRGGLALDFNMARTYFTKAAKLGQVQAQRALDMEHVPFESEYVKDTNVLPVLYGNTVNFRHDNCIRNMFKMVNSYKDGKLSYVNRQQGSEMSPCQQSIPDTRTPTEIFLGLLGLNQSSSLPTSHSFLQ